MKVEAGGQRERVLLPFLAGVLAGVAGGVLARALVPKPGLDTRLIRRLRQDPDLPPVVFVPGILGSELVRPDGSQVWLNLGNALGHHDLSLPLALPFSESRDTLRPAGLLGVDAVLPRLFGFTEYADFLDLIESAGFGRDRPLAEPGATHHVFTYDWRRDLVESSRVLDQALEELADRRGDPGLRVNLVGHSMGGLLARYYLRFGGGEPTGVTWAGARRIRNLILVATPNGGGVQALDAILNGNRVGFSNTTLASGVIERMPAIYQLLPPAGVSALIDERGERVEVDLQGPGTWERFGWGPFGSGPRRRHADQSPGEPEPRREFVRAALERARGFHDALARAPETPCPVRVVVLSGDCLPTLGRAVVTDRPGEPPRFEPQTRAEAESMLEAGDGRVTRASALASHLPGADEDEGGCGLPEVTQAVFGAADHHGIYNEPAFQSALLRILLRPPGREGVRKPRGSAVAAAARQV